MTYRINIENTGLASDAQAQEVARILAAKGYDVEFTADFGAVNPSESCPCTSSEWEDALIDADAAFPAIESIDPDAYVVYSYSTGEELDGLPTEDLVRESLAAGPTGAVKASYDADQAQWDYVPADQADAAVQRGDHVRTVYVEEA